MKRFSFASGSRFVQLGVCVSWVCIITHRHASRLVLALVIPEFGESEEAVSEMAEMRGRGTWTEELASLIEDSGVRYGGDPNASSATSFEVRRSVYAPQSEWVESGESLKEQALGFVMAWCEILLELGRGFRDILRQNLMNKDSYVVRKFGGPCSKVSKRLRFLNDFLPEDRDPVHAWSIVFFVFFLALAGVLLLLLSRTIYFSFSFAQSWYVLLRTLHWTLLD